MKPSEWLRANCSLGLEVVEHAAKQARPLDSRNHTELLLVALIRYLDGQHGVISPKEAIGPEREEPDPEIREDGLPLCREKCVHHDGKRCRMLGFRPDRICEPHTLRMAERMRRADEAGVP